MRFNTFVAYAVFTSGLSGSALAQNAARANNNAAASLTLDQNALQTGSQQAGAGGDAGQAASLTDNANFINFCTQTGQSLTNGLQLKQGSCNGIVMGQIPPQANMVSSLIVSPSPGQDIQENQSFDVNVQTANLVAGSFTNPDDTYYSAPQQLKNNMVVGHTHVTIQPMQSLNQQTALDAEDFVFFKGINDAGNGKGLLTATVAKGLPAGAYRICTLAGASNHQPVLMPVAQRGAQDDCQKITVGGASGGNANANANANANSGNSGNANAKGGNKRLRFMQRDFVA